MKSDTVGYPIKPSFIGAPPGSPVDKCHWPAPTHGWAQVRYNGTKTVDSLPLELHAHHRWAAVDASVGTYEWVPALRPDGKPGYCRAKFTAGPRAIAWMEAQDRAYLNEIKVSNPALFLKEMTPRGELPPVEQAAQLGLDLSLPHHCALQAEFALDVERIVDPGKEERERLAREKAVAAAKEAERLESERLAKEKTDAEAVALAAAEEQKRQDAEKDKKAALEREQREQDKVHATPPIPPGGGGGSGSSEDPPEPTHSAVSPPTLPTPALSIHASLTQSLCSALRFEGALGEGGFGTVYKEVREEKESAPVSTAYEALLKRAAQKYLGHDYDPLAGRLTMTAPCDLTRISIIPEGAATHIIHAQDEASCERQLSIRFGLTLTALPGGGGLAVTGSRATAHQQGNYCLYVVRSVNTRCVLARSPVRTDVKPETACYIREASLSIGYIIVVNVKTLQDARTLQRSLTVSAHPPGMIVTADAGIAHGATERVETHNVNIEIRGLGAYVPPDISKGINETYGDYLSRIRREIDTHFMKTYQTLSPGELQIQAGGMVPYQEAALFDQRAAEDAYRSRAAVLADLEISLGGAFLLSLPKNTEMVNYQTLLRLQEEAQQNILLLQGLAHVTAYFKKEIETRLQKLDTGISTYLTALKDKHLILLRESVRCTLQVEGESYYLSGDARVQKKGCKRGGQFCTMTKDRCYAMSLSMEMANTEDGSLFLTGTEEFYILSTEAIRRYLKISQFDQGIGFAWVDHKKEASTWSLKRTAMGFILMSMNRKKRGFVFCAPQQKEALLLACAKHFRDVPAGTCVVSFEPTEPGHLNQKIGDMIMRGDESSSAAVAAMTGSFAIGVGVPMMPAAPVGAAALLGALKGTRISAAGGGAIAVGDGATATGGATAPGGASAVFASVAGAAPAGPAPDIDARNGGAIAVGVGAQAHAGGAEPTR